MGLTETACSPCPVEHDQRFGSPKEDRSCLDRSIALFNENRKEGGASERNFGVLKGDVSKAYDMDLSCQFCRGGWQRQSESGAGSSSGASTWCVVKPHTDEKLVEEVVAFCCRAGGVDCRDIEEKGSCHLPNSAHAHASYAMNAYYHMHGHNC